MKGKTTQSNDRNHLPLTLPMAADEPIQRPNIAGIILCGGSGTRMNCPRTHKVCENIHGRPAIVRLIDTLRVAGVDPLVVVVGYRAGDVVETIGACHPGIQFVYQRDRLGTGHAAMLAVESLCHLGYQGPVLITMGDKWFDPDLMPQAFKRFQKSQADLLLITTPKHPESSAGRLVHLRGRGIVGIVERRDIERAQILREWLALADARKTLTRATLRRVGLKHIRPAQKLWRALGPLAGYARGGGTVSSSELIHAVHQRGTKIQVGPATLHVEEVNRFSESVNESVYIGKIDVLRAALRRVGRNNAQDEYYLTDVIGILAADRDENEAAASSRVVEYRLPRHNVMAFNNREELVRIENHVRLRERDQTRQQAEKKLQPYLRDSRQWLKLLNPSAKEARQLVERIYGAGGPLVPERIRDLSKTVRLFAQRFDPERKIFLVRAPGRINLMGRHVDHQGGFSHTMALDREVVMAVAPRNDDVVRLVNVDPVVFPTRELVINDWRDMLSFPDWPSFVNSDRVRAYLQSTVGNWSNYVLAAVLFQQFLHRDRRILGMDVAVNGQVPQAAGLSSSSSIVVSSMEAICAVNGIAAGGSDIVNWCGQAEWFVGSRGGSADHAAIRLSRAGHVARMGFHPFKISGYVPLSDESAVLIAYSGQSAAKSVGARDRYNERVACYRLGVLLLKQRYPRWASRIDYVRDFTPARLGITPDETRKMLNELPEEITRAELRKKLGKAYAARLDTIFASHADLGPYTIREVMAYGVGEYERSRVAAQFLKNNDLGGFGELMWLSHDGDRVNGRYIYLPQQGLDDSEPLYRLIGAYACSTPDIDDMIDIARATPGVYGAQLAGAGLGGCVMILAHGSAVSRIKSRLTKEYYQPRGMAPALWQVHCVSGAGLIRP